MLLAYVKIVLEREILAADLPDEAWTDEVLADYFPTPLRERFADRMAGHRLRREIVTTVLVNEVVNRGGTSFVFRAIEETGASRGRRDPGLRGGARRLRPARPVGGRRGAGQQGADRRRRRWSTWRPGGCSTGRCAGWSPTGARRSTCPARSPGCGPACRDAAAPAGRRCSVGTRARALRAHVAALVERGVPAGPGRARPPGVMYGFGLLDIVEVGAADRPRRRRGGDGLLRAVRAVPGRRRCCRRSPLLPREDRWQTLARMALRYDLYAALAALTAEVLAVDAVRRARRRTGSPSGSRPTRRRSPAPATRSASSTSRRPTWRRCRCCCARSASSCVRRQPAEPDAYPAGVVR